jgi:hypothetical protein
MNLKDRILGSRTATSITAAIAAIAIAAGGYAVASPGSSPSASAGISATAGSTGKVIPFDRGNPSPATKVGQVPSSFKAGAGTIVTGTAADKAKAAAVAAYPGGTVNRVVLLSDGQYNVHVIGVNWPHHVFVSKDFKVVGAE